MMFEDKDEERDRHKVDIDEDEESDQEIYFNSENHEPMGSETAARTFLQTEKEPPKVERPKETVNAPAPKPVQPLSYDEARHLALMKLGFFKAALGLVFANILLFGVSWYQIAFTGQTWFVWPVILSVVYLGFRAFKVFVFRGRDLRGVMDNLIDKMTEAEVTKSEIHTKF